MNKHLFKSILRVVLLALVLGGWLVLPQSALAQPSTLRGRAAPQADSPAQPLCGDPAAANPLARALPTASDLLAPMLVSDLTITLADAPDPVAPGAALTYYDIISNVGNQTATGVSLVDTLPPGVTYVSGAATQGACSHAGGQVTCSLGSIAPNQTETVTILVQVDAGTRGTITNRATVTGNEPDRNTANNSGAIETTVSETPAGEFPDLTILLADAPDPVIPLATLTYIAIISNTGPEPATGVTVSDTLPDGLTFVSAAATQGACQEAGRQVTCSLGELDTGATARVTIVTRVDTDVAGTIVDTASVHSNESDANPLDNADSEGTLVIDTANSVDLSITMVDAPDPVPPGASLEYVNVISNVGGLAATQVVMTDTLPAGVTYVSTTTTLGTCQYAGGQVVCQLGTLASGGSARVTIDLTVNPTTLGTLVNTAEVMGNEDEFYLANNWDDEGTMAVAVADMAIENVSTPNPTLRDKNLTYNLTVTNHGPSTATGIVMTDTLPAVTSFVSVTSGQGDCSHAGSVLTCALGSLPPGGSISITVIVYVRSDFVGDMSSLARVSANEYDPCQLNNPAIAETNVRGLTFFPFMKYVKRIPFQPSKR